MAAHYAHAFEIWKERQRKYGPGNIARRGPQGVMIRLDDKLARLDNVFFKGGKDTPDESVRDTLYDAANYPLIALACWLGEWPGWPHG